MMLLKIKDLFTMFHFTWNISEVRRMKKVITH